MKFITKSLVKKPELLAQIKDINYREAYSENEFTEEELNKAVQNYINPNYINLIVEYQGELVEALRKSEDITGFIFDDVFAIISVKKEKFPDAIVNIDEVIFTTPAGLYTLGTVSPVETSYATKFHNNIYLTLDGQEVLVGILDTGIDYLNEEFLNEEGNTRIESIWDQTIEEDKKTNNYLFGTEYTRNNINEALKAKKDGKNPYEVVPSKDIIGHGTHMASLVGAGGKNPDLTGAAPRCDFVIVKLAEASLFNREYFGVYEKGNPCFSSTDVILGVKYLFEKAKEVGKPMVILIPIGSNIGAHDGTAPIERYIDSISKSRGITVVTMTGNQGDAENHTTGIIPKAGDFKIIELKIGKGQKNIYFDIWCKKPDKVGLEITSPSGEIVDKISARLNQTVDVKFVYEGTKMSITFYLPEEVTGDERITIRATDIKEGIWKFKLIGELIVSGRYDAWLNQIKLLDSDTKFLNSSAYTTIVIPGTSSKAITVAFYNQNNNSNVIESGKGYTRDGRIKPDIAAGGVEALVADPTGRTSVVSGSSVASAVVAGCCALLYQWGIIYGNDPNMYSTKMKTYLIRGTFKREGDVYPNQQWGYGIINMDGVFSNIRNLGSTNIYKDRGRVNKYKEDIEFEPIKYELRKYIYDDELYEEYYKNNIFIRKPVYFL
ncbi:S8 family peptidase [Clostridium cavendishii]|nr:S8 family peptidase [Clostridium cavendishii]